MFRSIVWITVAAAIVFSSFETMEAQLFRGNRNSNRNCQANTYAPQAYYGQYGQAQLASPMYYQTAYGYSVASYNQQPVQLMAATAQYSSAAPQCTCGTWSAAPYSMATPGNVPMMDPSPTVGESSSALQSEPAPGEPVQQATFETPITPTPRDTVSQADQIIEPPSEPTAAPVGSAERSILDTGK